MRKNKLTLWKNDSSLCCQLFFAQRMDELLFHHTTDTYRYLSLSIRGLVAEFCTVYKDVHAGLINKKNLSHIIDEISFRLKNDNIAKVLLTDEFVSRFQKKYKNWDIKTQFENVRYIGKRLSNRSYYNCISQRLKDLILENKEKKEIDTLTSLFVRELLDCGYNENYVYKTLHDIFFHREVSSLDSFETFLNVFDFSTHKFDVYIGYSKDISALLPLFEKFNFTNLKVSIVDPVEVPIGIKTKRQKSILKFEEIESYDMFSAFEMANAVSLCVVNSYSFFRHDPYSIRIYGQVVDTEKNITTIHPKNLLKYRVAALSREDSTKNAESLMKVLLANYDNLSNFIKITKMHNAAILSENTSDSLLSLWSILESIVEDDSLTEDKKTESNEDKKTRSKIGNVISYTIPYLKSTYIKKLVHTCMLDIIRWDEFFFNEYIAKNEFGSNNIERTFAFLAFQSSQPQRDILYSMTEDFPLLKNRVSVLSEKLMNSKGIKHLINQHTQRIEWHLHRIYRARNYIIHDANEDEELNEELVINLHSYVDILFTEIISLISSSPYNDSIHDAITGHKLSVLIMDEKLENRKNEEITPENALQYLYYDFQR